VSQVEKIHVPKVLEGVEEAEDVVEEVVGEEK
jgi:hypothetical protein